MSPNAQKRKGSDWERELVKILNKAIQNGTFKRVPGSGAMGTYLEEPALYSDIKGKVIGLEKPIKIEAKVGYGGSKQLTLKKEWLDKIALEASRTYSIPFLIGRFSGSRSGVENFVVMDLQIFIDLMNTISDLSELDK